LPCYNAGESAIQGFSDSTNYHLLIPMTLTWESTYAIALELRRQHPDINIEEVSLGQIYQWTIQLNEFEDDLALANDDILYAIYQDWFEENIHGK
jgi:FeS assembly protein IscX